MGPQKLEDLSPSTGGPLSRATISN